MSFITQMVGFLPCSVSLSYWFNFGSLLGMSLVMQIISGLMLVINYNSLESYDSIMYIMMEVNYGWFFKAFHSNNASIIFMALFLHLYKNVRMSSYRLHAVWYSGLVMMLIIMAAAFTGYVLVGSQMSYWAAMVITSLVSVVPFVGEELLYFIWGGYSISWVTLQLLFLIHFVLPFVVVVLMGFHLYYLHSTGSTSPIFSHTGLMKITFFPYFWIKDSMNLLVYWVFITLMLLYPYALGEVELFEEANTLSSPMHIVPEWYFCSQYAILRSVPSKGMGILLMLLSVMVFFIYPLSISYITPVTGLRDVVWVVYFSLHIYLSYLGFSPISQPYVMLALVGTLLTLLYHVLMISVNLMTTIFFSLED